ncbi:putative conjugative transfer protein TraH [Orientia tsutsugamushi str. TA716]|uniref:Putative conjugative transfer protein TraH n=1 Tax=Orientia tsutsugamushi str. TA716 TaxID=1359175 RepID=A0A0F3P077_ORITS|nr:putative conjugative transfer protein TraH [Orientia tsutsugamushi str. TA716]
MSIRIRVYAIAALFSLQAPVSLAWNIENVFQGMSVNVTRSGSYQIKRLDIMQLADYLPNKPNIISAICYNSTIFKHEL